SQSVASAAAMAISSLVFAGKAPSTKIRSVNSKNFAENSFMRSGWKAGGAVTAWASPMGVEGCRPTALHEPDRWSDEGRPMTNTNLTRIAWNFRPRMKGGQKIAHFVLLGSFLLRPIAADT